jgi:hypothetical protein
VLCLVGLFDAEIRERIDARNGTQKDVAAISAVPAIGAAQRDEFLAAETGAAAAAVAGLHPNPRFIYELHGMNPKIKTPA